MLIAALILALIVAGSFAYLYLNGISGMNYATGAMDGQIRDCEMILCTLPSAFFLEGQTEGITHHDIQPLIKKR